MITIAQIEDRLEKADFPPKQSRAIAEAIELAQRKTQEEVETDLKEWMDGRLATKVEMGELKTELKTEMGEMKADILKWMFIFWVGQLAAVVAIVKLIR